MSQYFHIHPDNPQSRLIRQAAEIIRNGGVVAYPTDSAYALGCHLGDKDALERIRRLRQLDDKHNFTLVSRDLSDIGVYAKVDNTNFRLLKAATPGAYTFVLPASKVVPNWLAHPKRKTIGIRVPSHPVARAIAEALDAPIMSVTAQGPDDEIALSEAMDVRDVFDKQLDLIVDSGATGIEATTVVDLTGAVPEILRMGKGSAEALGL